MLLSVLYFVDRTCREAIWSRCFYLFVDCGVVFVVIFSPPVFNRGVFLSVLSDFSFCHLCRLSNWTVVVLGRLAVGFPTFEHRLLLPICIACNSYFSQSITY